MRGLLCTPCCSSRTLLWIAASVRVLRLFGPECTVYILILSIGKEFPTTTMIAPFSLHSQSQAVKTYTNNNYLLRAIFFVDHHFFFLWRMAIFFYIWDLIFSPPNISCMSPDRIPDRRSGSDPIAIVAILG